MLLKHLVRFVVAVVVSTSCAHAADKERPLMKDFMGINGHTINFKPDLYRPTCTLVRDYHNIDWDTGADPATPTQFPKGEKSKETWLDWGTMYGSWRKAGFRIDACLQWNSKTLPPEKWTDPVKQGRAYGEAFAKYFGSGGEKLVESIEIGNEPGSKYDDATYFKIFEGMAAGVRAADPKMKIATCTVNVPGDNYSKPLAPFLPHKDLFDIINVHQYALKSGWPTWERSYPEDTSVAYTSVVQEVIDYRNKNLPGKEIWLTEFGYDASTKPATGKGTFAKWMDVDDDVQARYIVRSFLVFSTMDVDRAYLYFFNDSDEPAFHGSSGITRKFQPKPSYYAMAHLSQTLGEYRFTRKVREEKDKLFVYEYCKGSDRNDRIYVAWSPTGSNDTSNQEIELPAKPTSATRMPQAEGKAPEIDVQGYKNGKVTLPINGDPIYVHVKL
jgi:serine/threonine-protein kinase ATR